MANNHVSVQLESSNVAARELLEGTGTAVSVPVCSVTWQQCVEESPSKRCGAQKNPDAHRFHDQNMVLWWRHCRPDSLVNYVWFVEYDAFFNGDVSNFIHAFGNNKADLIASGFRIAGSNWFKYQWFSTAPGLKTNFTQTSKVVANVDVLATSQTAKCNGHMKDDGDVGVIFVQDHVLRMSDRFLRILSQQMANDVLGPSEGFISTLCASNLGFPDRAPCTMYDMQPSHTNSSAPDSDGIWLSDIYCYDWRSHIRASKKEHCHNYLNQWVHKFDCDDITALNCQRG